MGEIAEMHLDGTLCETCGAYLGEAVGYPRKCAGCGGDSQRVHHGCLHIYTSLRKRPFTGGFHVGRYCDECNAWIKWEKQTEAVLKELLQQEETA